MADPLDQPFDENDEIVGVTLVREDLRLLLVVARIHQMVEQKKGRAPGCPVATCDRSHWRNRDVGGMAAEKARLTTA